MQCKGNPVLAGSIQKGDQRYAINLKAEVEGAIERQTFQYEAFFPESKRARLFGHANSQITIRELIEEWLPGHRAHASTQHLPVLPESCNAHLFPKFGDIRARDLTPQHIRAWIQERSGTLKSIPMI